VASAEGETPSVPEVDVDRGIEQGERRRLLQVTPTMMAARTITTIVHGELEWIASKLIKDGYCLLALSAQEPS
jgi:hypothetical protein